MGSRSVRYACLRITIPRSTIDHPSALLLRPPGKALQPSCFVLEFDDLLGRAAMGLRTPMTPLFKVEWDVECTALIAKGSDPVGVCRSGIVPAFPACNDPADLLQFHPRTQVDCRQQRLARKEAHMRINRNQPLNASESPALILGGGPQPYIGAWAACPRIDVLDMTWSFCEQQPVQVRRHFDEVPELSPPRIQIGAWLEYIRHGRAENASADSLPFCFRVPAQRFAPVMITKKSPGRIATPKLIAEPPSPSFRIAMGARGRELYATPPRVKRVMRPLDVRILSHCSRTTINGPFRAIRTLGLCARFEVRRVIRCAGASSRNGLSIL